MAWTFPEGVPFDIRTKTEYFSNARLVEVDSEHLTIDFESKANVILRAQIQIEDIESLYSRAPIEEEIRHAGQESRDAELHGHVQSRRPPSGDVSVA